MSHQPASHPDADHTIMSRRPFRRREHHRDVQGGAIRAAIFGVSDGLVTNASLILGVAGADAMAGTVRLAGLAGLVAGAISMAAGEYVSMSAQTELLERELDVERQSIARDPDYEEQELAEIYKARGIDETTADQLSSELMRDETIALEVHAREELGVDPNALGSPYGAAASSFVSFAVGGTIPLLPWFFMEGDSAVVLSMVLAAITALAIGAAIGISTGRGPLRSAIRQLAIAVLAGAATFVIGSLLGVEVS
jgi:VIT1/CCC1 family predicted Fe2+/Mn2+ transporter